MALFLVNLGASVTVEAADEGAAIQAAKDSTEKNYFHVQVQPIINRETFVPDPAPEPTPAP